MNLEVILILFFGAAGALTKEILKDNTLELPKVLNGQLFLGFFGATIVGALTGYFVDHSPLMAFFSGYTGFSALGHLLPTTPEKTETNTPAATPLSPETSSSAPPLSGYLGLSIPVIIKKIATEYGIDPALALRVAKCESGLNPKARNVNTSGSIDRGLYQINDYYHKEVTTASADNPVFATKWFCEAVKNGHLDWWNSSKKCWFVA